MCYHNPSHTGRPRRKKKIQKRYETKNYRLVHDRAKQKVWIYDSFSNLPSSPPPPLCPTAVCLQHFRFSRERIEMCSFAASVEHVGTQRCNCCVNSNWNTNRFEWESNGIFLAQSCGCFTPFFLHFCHSVMGRVCDSCALDLMILLSVCCTPLWMSLFLFFYVYRMLVLALASV